MPKCKDCIHSEICANHLKAVRDIYGAVMSISGREVNRLEIALSEISITIGQICCDGCDHFQDRSRFVELPPCKEGDSVYSICFCYGEGDTITEWTVVDIFLLSSKEEGNSIGIRLKGECIFISILPCELGNRYFLTKEAAEQALKERESNA